MIEKKLSSKQGIAIIFFITAGDTLIFGRATQAKEDFWISIILAVFFSLPIVLIHSKLLMLFPEKDLFDINEHIFGFFVGKLLNLLFIMYCALNVIGIIFIFPQFATTVSLDKTPKEIPGCIIVFLCIWLIKEGLNILGEIGQLFLTIVIVLVFISIMLLMPYFRFSNIQPTMYHGIVPILQGTYSTMMFPFTETIVATMVIYNSKVSNSIYKVFIKGILLSGSIILIFSLAQVFVLGIEIYSTSFFPAYLAIRRINYGYIIKGIEIIPASFYILGGFMKMVILILAISKGVAKLFYFNHYKFIVTPTALLLLTNIKFFFKDFMQIYEFTEAIWVYMVLPFHVILPVIIFIGGLVKLKISKQLNRS